MKKIILVLGMALILGGCQVKNGSTPAEVKKTDVFTSIKDAVTKQLVLKCDYADDKGETVTIYMKGDTVRLKGTGTEKTAEALLKGNNFYLWDNVKKEGMVIDMSKSADDGSMSMGDKKVKSVDDIVGVLEEKKNNCVVSPESAGLLELPTDVKIVDAPEFFK